ncbi:MAG TPA: carbohydrate kinase [Candidatus Deferrimicrobium sp.]|nr:carbohydrate kinase [Candidatus Deferrimicrobium sp.]
MVDIISIGEVLIDFISDEADKKLKDVSNFKKFPGGAPANVLVVASSLGAKTGLISRVGDDPFGEFLIETLKAKGVDTSQVVRDKYYHTGVVFVELKKAKPNFTLYTNVAYNFMNKEELNKEYIQNAEALNFGSVTLLMEPSRSATLEAIKIAKGHTTITCDVNFRSDLWKYKMEEMWQVADEVLKEIEILKLGYEEALQIGAHLSSAQANLTLDEALQIIYTTLNPKLIAITLGGKGSRLLLIKDNKIHIDVSQAVYKVVAKDTVGAGDAFFGSLLYMLNKMKKLRSLENLTENEMKRILIFSNTFAALSTTRKGAWNLPKIKDIMYISEIKDNFIE